MIEPRDVVGVLLAAGRSRRFGRDDKLMAMLDREPLVVHAARPLLRFGPMALLAVCADEHAAPARLLAALGFEIVVNPLADIGLSTSLARGIERAADTAAQAALVCLGDMPFIGPPHLSALAARFDAGSSPIVASCSGGAATPPAVFARALFDRLQAGAGDEGARRLLGQASVVWTSPAELRDIDCSEDLTDS